MALKAAKRRNVKLNPTNASTKGKQKEKINEKRLLIV